MESVRLKVGSLEANDGQVPGLPRNPRFIRDAKYEALKRSIVESPEMLGLRELIVYPFGLRFVVVCGNMRLRACKELGYEELPCKVLPEDTSVDKLREYAVKDNYGYGEDDWDLLANEWDAVELADWGIDVPIMLDDVEDREEDEKEERYIVRLMFKDRAGYDDFLMMEEKRITGNYGCVMTHSSGHGSDEV